MVDFSVSPSLTYVDGTLWQAVRATAERFSRLIAYDFMGKSTSYRQFAREVEQCAKALLALGVRPGDRVTVCLPNCPQAVVLFYAVNAVGGVANMVVLSLYFDIFSGGLQAFIFATLTMMYVAGGFPQSEFEERKAKRKAKKAAKLAAKAAKAAQ